MKVNAEKSKVDKPKGIKYLGFGFYFDSFAKAYKARPHQKAVAKPTAMWHSNAVIPLIIQKKGDIAHFQS